jgi:hypothetical protein
MNDERPHDAPARASPWPWLAVLVSAAQSLAFNVFPGRGLTFFSDDWLFLRDFQERGPASWLVPHNGHWFVLCKAILCLEFCVLGGHHDAYLVFTWAIHVANVYLLARVLLERVGDARVAALAAAAFGLSGLARETIWCAQLSGLALCESMVLLGFLAATRARRRGGAWFIATGLAAFLAPLAWTAGLMLGPTLALEAWLLPRNESRRMGGALAALGGAAVFLVGFAISSRGVPGDLPRSQAALAHAAIFFVYECGLGLVKGVLCLPGADTPSVAIGYTCAYAVAVAFVWLLARPRERDLVITGQFLLGGAFMLVAAGRWQANPLWAECPRYHYVAATGGAMLLAAALGRASEGRFARRAVVWAGTATLLLLMGLLQAREAARDIRPYAPAARRAETELAVRLVRAVEAADAPVWNGHAPWDFAGLTLKEVVDIASPGNGVRWTDRPSGKSFAPLAIDPVVLGNLLEQLQPLLADPTFVAELKREVARLRAR